MAILDAEAITVIERLGLAALLGGLVVWERGQRNKQAGFKTHMLVAVGSALIKLVQQTVMEKIIDKNGCSHTVLHVKVQKMPKEKILLVLERLKDIKGVKEAFFN